jgi:hypothetical protein
MARYDRLRAYLEAATEARIELRFTDLAELVGGLPASARNHAAWWANSPHGHSHARAWLDAGWRVVDLNLTAETVRFTRVSEPDRTARLMEAPVGHQTWTEPAPPPPVTVDLAPVWEGLAHRLQEHIDAGLLRLLTEDAVRFATVTALVDAGVDAPRLHAEYRVPEIDAALDLAVDDPPSIAIEFKYPREREGAADTMTMGELLRDLYRLAWLDLDHAFAVHLTDARLRGYLHRRGEVAWTVTPGERLRLPVGLANQLPRTARRCLPAWTVPLAVDAHCTASIPVGDLLLVTYRVTGLPAAATDRPSDPPR